MMVTKPTLAEAIREQLRIASVIPNDYTSSGTKAILKEIESRLPKEITKKDLEDSKYTISANEAIGYNKCLADVRKALGL